MNLTDKEAQRFRSAVNHLLDELPKLVPHKDKELPLNNKKYTYSYTQDKNRLYISLLCEGLDAYYFYIELDSDTYIIRGWSYFKGKPDNSKAFTLFVGLSEVALNLDETVLILNSISSKERFVNLYTVLCLIVQTNTFLDWKN